MNNGLNVHWGDRLVGRVWLDEQRNFIFQYDAAWLAWQDAIPISLQLRLQPNAFMANASKPFFSNLLPEGRIRTQIARRLGVSESNDFNLLEALGGDCAGALSLLPEGRAPQTDGEYQAVSEEELDTMTEDALRRPLLAAREGLRLSLAGAQNKLPVYVEKDSIFLPRGAFPSSHILKPKIPEFQDTVENEAFCMMLAMKCGMPVSDVLVRDGKPRTLLVLRYDREWVDGSLTRLHQEDFCQALGHSHEEKYQAEGGPGLKECLALLQDTSASPIIDKGNLLRATVYNYLIGNCDAHAKNFSLLLAKAGVRLAPLYDLMSTVIYEELPRTLAMKIGGEDRPDWVMKRHWERLAADADVGARAIFDMCAELGETLPVAANTLAKTFVAHYGAHDTIRKIVAYASSMGDRLIKGLRREAPA